jgi:hypothetical protein
VRSVAVIGETGVEVEELFNAEDPEKVRSEEEPTFSKSKIEKVGHPGMLHPPPTPKIFRY